MDARIVFRRIEENISPVLRGYCTRINTMMTRALLIVTLLVIWVVPTAADPPRESRLAWVLRDPPKATSYTIDDAGDAIGITHHIDEWQHPLSLEQVAETLSKAGLLLARERDFKPEESVWLGVVATEGYDLHLTVKAKARELAAAPDMPRDEHERATRKRQHALLDIVTIEAIGPEAARTAYLLCAEQARKMPRFCAQAVLIRKAP